jgi:hypothetical protein
VSAHRAGENRLPCAIHHPIEAHPLAVGFSFDRSHLCDGYDVCHFFLPSVGGAEYYRFFDEYYTTAGNLFPTVVFSKI